MRTIPTCKIRQLCYITRYCLSKKCCLSKHLTQDKHLPTFWGKSFRLEIKRLFQNNLSYRNIVVGNCVFPLFCKNKDKGIIFVLFAFFTALSLSIIFSQLLLYWTKVFPYLLYIRNALISIVIDTRAFRKIGRS